MKLICLACHRTRELSPQEQAGIAGKLAKQPPACREMIECRCGLGQFALALHRPRCA